MSSDDKFRFKAALKTARLNLDDRDFEAALPVFAYLAKACDMLKADEKADDEHH